MSIPEAMKKFPSLRILNDKTGNMKKTNQWFYQIQGQLHITERKYCIFSMRTNLGILVLHIMKEDRFWIEKIEPYLSTFYADCLLSETLDPRKPRNMLIREPKSVQRAQNLKKTAVSKIDKQLLHPW